MNEGEAGARLLGRTGEFSDVTHVFTDAATLGRSNGNDIVLNSPYLSGRHARIRFSDGDYLIEDLGSRNGTRVDGVAVTGEVMLDRVCVITLADAVDLVFVRTFGAIADHETLATQNPVAVIDLPETAGAEPGAVEVEPDIAAAAATGSTVQLTSTDLEFGAMIDPRADATTAAPAYDLILDLPDGGRRVYPLETGDNVLGRSDDCDVKLPDPEKWLSRRHATLTVSPEGVHVTDHGSVNGTFVNGERVAGGAPIHAGAALRIGPHLDLKLVRR